MSAGNDIGGIFTFRFNGQTVECEGTCTYNFTSKTRETKVALSGKVYKTTAPRVAFVEATIFTTPELNIAELYEQFGSEADDAAIIQLANGQTWMLSPAHLAGEQDGDAQAGTTVVRVEGVPQQVT